MSANFIFMDGRRHTVKCINRKKELNANIFIARRIHECKFNFKELMSLLSLPKSYTHLPIFSKGAMCK